MNKNSFLKSPFLWLMCLSLLLSNKFLYSQLPTCQWSNGVPGTTLGYDLACDNVNNAYITGGSIGIFVAKYNMMGVQQWSFTVGVGFANTGQAITVDDTSNIYVTGRYTGTVDFNPSPSVTYNLTSSGGIDAFVAKYDSLGNFIWAFNIGGTNTDQSQDIVIDNKGDVIIVGEYSNICDFNPSSSFINALSTSSTNSNAFVAKYSSYSGSYIWAFDIGTSSFADVAYGVTIDINNNIYVVGMARGIIDFDPSIVASTSDNSGSTQAAFLAKYDEFSNYQYAFFMPGSVSVSNSVCIDNGNNVTVVGYTGGVLDFDPSGSVANNIYMGGSSDIFVAQYNGSTGSHSWSFGLGGTASDNAVNVISDAIGNIYITGNYDLVADFDPSPLVSNLTTNGNADIFIAKYTTAGIYEWAFGIGSLGTVEIGRAMAILSSGDIYLTGQYENTCDFDPSPVGTSFETSSGTSDIFLARYNQPIVSTSILTFDNNFKELNIVYDVYDVIGHLLFSNKIGKKISQLNLKPGLYILNTDSGMKKIFIN